MHVLTIDSCISLYCIDSNLVSVIFPSHLCMLFEICISWQARITHPDTRLYDIPVFVWCSNVIANHVFEMCQ